MIANDKSLHAYDFKYPKSKYHCKLHLSFSLDVHTNSLFCLHHHNSVDFFNSLSHGNYKKVIPAQNYFLQCTLCKEITIRISDIRERTVFTNSLSYAICNI